MRIRRVEYEGIHLICFGCGKYGHKKEACPENVILAEPVIGVGAEKDAEKND